MSEQKNPGIAAVLSFIFNGLGQLYNGEIVKGLWIMFFSSISMLMIILGAVFAGHWLLTRILSVQELIWGVVVFILGVIFACILGIYSIFDAYKVAKKTL